MHGGWSESTSGFGPAESKTGPNLLRHRNVKVVPES